MITLEASWHTDREWFVRRNGSYCGEVVYNPNSIRWHARPWRVSGRQTGMFFDTMDEAVQFTLMDYPRPRS